MRLSCKALHAKRILSVLLKIDIAKAFDSVLFVAPLQQDLVVLKLALEVFGLASGLFANLDKSVATPLHCAEEDITRIQQILACRVEGFPSRYLGSLYLSSDLNGAMSNRFGRGTYSTSLAERLWQEAHYLQSRSIQQSPSTYPLGQYNALTSSVEASFGLGHPRSPVADARSLGRSAAGHVSLALSGWRTSGEPGSRCGCAGPGWGGQTTAVPGPHYRMPGIALLTPFFAAATISILGDGASTHFWTDNWLQGTSNQAYAIWHQRSSLGYRNVSGV